MSRLTKVQQNTIDLMKHPRGVNELHLQTQTFPPHASYLYCGIEMHIQWRTFEALRKKGAIKPAKYGKWAAV